MRIQYIFVTSMVLIRRQNGTPHAAHLDQDQKPTNNRRRQRLNQDLSKSVEVGNEQQRGKHDCAVEDVEEAEEAGDAIE